jgi:alcohol dehydrogenase (cytochrome c)
VLAVQKEPQNWLLHHGNYQGHRFSLLKEINADTVKNLKPVFTVALSGFQSGGRYAHGNLEATPLVEDGIMYVPDGWGSVYAIDVSAGKKGVVKWKMDPGTDRAWAGDVACCGVNNRGVALWKDKVISIALDGRMFAINKATGEVLCERKVADLAIPLLSLSQLNNCPRKMCVCLIAMLRTEGLDQAHSFTPLSSLDLHPASRPALTPADTPQPRSA